MTCLILTTYNRPHYLKDCLESLKRTDLTDVKTIIIDDCSTDANTLHLISAFRPDILMHNPAQSGIRHSLLHACDLAIKMGADRIINLDADAIVRNDFIQRISEMHSRFPNEIVTGFNCLTKNRDGSERHKIVYQAQDGTWNKKRSVGGVNMCFSTDVYQQHVRPALLKVGNWDHNACISAGGAVCVQPSVVQHIGLVSAMGHNHDLPDVADDFKPLSLPDVTLVCVDDNVSRAATAMNECAKDIAFGAVVSINPMPILGSKRAYSEYIMHELHKHITTSHMLVVQHDGFVKNWKAWSKEWLQWDYIGAPWEWYKDGMNVGNGGFVLKSKRLLELCKDLPLKNDKDINDFQVDHNICRIYRPLLESKGIKFAPLDVARKFSIEAYGMPLHLRRYSGQFGFHGSHVIF